MIRDSEMMIINELFTLEAKLRHPYPQFKRGANRAMPQTPR